MEHARGLRASRRAPASRRSSIQIYAAFVAGVARGRDLSRDEVLRVAAEGRVWTGRQAKELGLVDELGGFVRALELTKEAVGIAPEQAVELRVFPEQR